MPAEQPCQQGTLPLSTDGCPRSRACAGQMPELLSTAPRHARGAARTVTCTVGYCLHSWDKHRPVWSQPNPYGKPGGDSGERSSQGGMRHGNARGSSGEPACIAALEPALVPCKLPVPMCILFQTNIKNSYFYLKLPCQVLAPESGRISKENRRTDSLQALVVQPYVRIPSPRLLLPCMGILSLHHEKKTYQDIVDPQG